MSTSATINDVDTNAKPSIIPELYDAVVFMVSKKVKNEDGTFTTETGVKVTTGDKPIKELREKKPDDILKEQQIRGYKVTSYEGLLELCGGDADEANYIMNRGIQGKINQCIQELATLDTDGNLAFQFVEGAFDSKEWIARETKRRNLSETEKMDKFVKNLDPVMQKMLAQLLASKGII